MLVGSAPQFPHGSIDDIEAIAELGKVGFSNFLNLKDDHN